MKPSFLLVAASIFGSTCDASPRRIDIPINFRNGLATVELGVGTPPEKHTFLFDTGSSDAWVIDYVCAQTCENTSGRNRTGYNASASSTHHSLRTYSTINYFSHTVSGTGTADMFRASASGCLAWNQTFLAVNASGANVPVDGFVGLGFSTGSSPGLKSPVETMLAQDLLAEPRFGIYYGKTLGRGSRPDGSGVITLGTSKEETYVDGDVEWIPVTGVGGRNITWLTSLHSIVTTREVQSGNGSGTVVQEDKISLKSAPLATILDTGSGVTGLPREHFDAVYASIGWNGTAVARGEVDMPCSALNSSWSVSFVIGSSGVASGEGSTTLPTRGDQLREPGYRGREDLCYPPFGSLAPGLLTVGAPVFHRVYTVWDYGGKDVAGYKPRVGFGRLKREFAPEV